MCQEATVKPNPRCYLFPWALATYGKQTFFPRWPCFLSESRVIKLTAPIRKPSGALAFVCFHRLTDVFGGDFDDGRFHEVVGEDEGAFLQRVQQHGGGVRLLRAVHVLPGFQGLWPQEVVHRVHDGLGGITEDNCSLVAHRRAGEQITHRWKETCWQR